VLKILLSWATVLSLYSGVDWKWKDLWKSTLASGSAASGSTPSFTTGVSCVFGLDSNTSAATRMFYEMLLSAIAILFFMLVAVVIGALRKEIVTPPEEIADRRSRREAVVRNVQVVWVLSIYTLGPKLFAASLMPVPCVMLGALSQKRYMYDVGALCNTGDSFALGVVALLMLSAAMLSVVVLMFRDRKALQTALAEGEQRAIIEEGSSESTEARKAVQAFHDAEKKQSTLVRLSRSLSGADEDPRATVEVEMNDEEALTPRQYARHELEQDSEEEKAAQAKRHEERMRILDRFSLWAYMCRGYESDFWWWELTVLCRKVIVMGVVIYCPSSVNPVGENVVVLSTLVAIGGLHCRSMPYINLAMDRLEACSFAVSIVSLLCAVQVSSFKSSFVDHTLGDVFATLLMLCFNAGFIVVCFAIVLPVVWLKYKRMRELAAHPEPVFYPDDETEPTPPEDAPPSPWYNRRIDHTDDPIAQGGKGKRFKRRSQRFHTEDAPPSSPGSSTEIISSHGVSFVPSSRVPSGRRAVVVTEEYIGKSAETLAVVAL